MKRIQRLLAAGLVRLAFAAAPIVLVACGEAAAGDPTPVKTFKITPAATGAEHTSAPEITATAPAAKTPAPGGSVLKLVGVSSTFDVTELEATSGPITIDFDNRDSGVVHNVAVYPGDDASEESLGATDLESGPIEQELKLTLEAGDYFYQCDAHPTTMKGTLRIESQ